MRREESLFSIHFDKEFWWNRRRDRWERIFPCVLNKKGESKKGKKGWMEEGMQCMKKSQGTRNNQEEERRWVRKKSEWGRRRRKERTWNPNPRKKKIELTSRRRMNILRIKNNPWWDEDDVSEEEEMMIEPVTSKEKSVIEEGLESKDWERRTDRRGKTRMKADIWCKEKWTWNIGYKRRKKGWDRMKKDCSRGRETIKRNAEKEQVTRDSFEDMNRTRKDSMNKKKRMQCLSLSLSLILLLSFLRLPFSSFFASFFRRRR